MTHRQFSFNWRRRSLWRTNQIFSSQRSERGRITRFLGNGIPRGNSEGHLCGGHKWNSVSLDDKERELEGAPDTGDFRKTQGASLMADREVRSVCFASSPRPQRGASIGDVPCTGGQRVGQSASSQSLPGYADNLALLHTRPLGYCHRFPYCHFTSQTFALKRKTSFIPSAPTAASSAMLVGGLWM